MPKQRLSCFRPIAVDSSSTTTTSSSSHVSGNPTLTTGLYHTQFGLFALTWCRNLLGRSFHLHLLLDKYYSPHFSSSFSSSSSTGGSGSVPSFHLLIKPFSIWKRRGSKKLVLFADDTSVLPSKVAHLFWDFCRVKFGSGPDPLSGYYFAVVIDGVLALLVGDTNPVRLSTKFGIGKETVVTPPPMKTTWLTSSVEDENQQLMFLKTEHVHGFDKSALQYTTRATIGDRVIDISIDGRFGDGDCDSDEPKLSFGIDNQKNVLQIKHLKWKFRGNDRIEIDGGVFVQVSWDVRKWLFEDHHHHNDSGSCRNDGHALFMFRFQQKLGMEDESLSDDYNNSNSNCGGERNGMWMLSQIQCQPQFQFHQQQQHQQSANGFFPISFDTTRRTKKSLLWSGRSSSSSSISSASSSCSSSVMEWASAEENELKSPAGFSLVIHAWKN